MRRPGQILKSLFSHERRQDKHRVRNEIDRKRVTKEHGESVIAVEARQEASRRQKMQLVHATKTHPGVKKTRNRRRDKAARASRKRNRGAYRG